MTEAFSKSNSKLVGGRSLLRILFVESSRADADRSVEELKRAGFRVSADVVQFPGEFCERICLQPYDIVLSADILPGWTGLDALQYIREMDKDIPFIMVTGFLGEKTAAECIQQGAADTVFKSGLKRLPISVHQVLEKKVLCEERNRAEAEIIRLHAELATANKELELRNHFSLPAELPSPGDSHASPRPAAGGYRRAEPLLLIVEDEPETRGLLARCLEREGYQTVSAPAGEEAVSRAQILCPDAITLNMRMPGRIGWKTFHQLKKNPETAGIPVVDASIMDRDNRKTVSLALGVAEHLRKPVTQEVLERAIQKHLGVGKEAPLTILAVDDDPGDLRSMTAAIHSAGYAYLAARGGREALEILDQTRPDAILLDLLMPEVDGFEVIRRIQQWPSLSDVPIFILTAEGLPEVDVEWLRRQTEIFFQAGGRWKAAMVTQLRRAIAHPHSRGLLEPS